MCAQCTLVIFTFFSFDLFPRSIFFPLHSFFPCGNVLFLRFFWRFNHLHFSFTKPTYFFLYSYLLCTIFVTFSNFVCHLHIVLSQLAIATCHIVIAISFHLFFLLYFTLLLSFFPWTIHSKSSVKSETESYAGGFSWLSSMDSLYDKAFGGLHGFGWDSHLWLEIGSVEITVD